MRAGRRADSDLDLVVLTNAPEFFRAAASWLDAIGWNDVGTCPVKWQDEDYGFFGRADCGSNRFVSKWKSVLLARRGQREPARSWDAARRR
jgi:hypothetical protein